jgi:hypothetical protein
MAMPVGDRGEGGGDAVRIADVACDGEGVSPDLGRHAFELVEPAAEQRDPVPERREDAGDGTAEPRVRPVMTMTLPIRLASPSGGFSWFRPSIRRRRCRPVR